LPERFAEDFAKFAEDDVAGSVAVIVVKSFEAVDVDDGNGKLLAVAERAGQFDSDTVVDITTIEKAGERISGSELEQFLAAGNEGEAEDGSGEHHDEPGDLGRPVEDAVREGSVDGIVQIPVRCREINEREILSEGEKAGGDADAFVVAEAGGADGEEIAFENNLAVDGGVGLIEEDEEEEGGADERDVEAGGGETEPGGIEFAKDEDVDGERKKEGGGGEADADEPFLGIDRKEERVDERNEKKKGGKRKADFGDEQFARNAGLREDGIGTRPERGQGLGEFWVHRIDGYGWARVRLGGRE